MLSLSFLFWKDDLSAEEEQERGCRQYQVEEPVVTFLDKFNPHLPSWAWLWTWVRVFVCPVWEWSAELLSAPPTSSLLLTLMWQNPTFFSFLRFSVREIKIPIFVLLCLWVWGNPCSKLRCTPTSFTSFPHYEVISLFPLGRVLISLRFADTKSKVSVELDPGILWSTCVFLSLAFSLSARRYPLSLSVFFLIPVSFCFPFRPKLLRSGSFF